MSTRPAASGRLWALLGVGALLLRGLSLAALALSAPYRGFRPAEIMVELPQGAAAGRIAEILHREGVIRSAGYFRLLARWRGRADRLQAGTYAFRGRSTPERVLERLVAGDVVFHNFIVPEGTTLRGMADSFARAGLGRRREFLAAAGRVEWIADLDRAADDLEGYLFPDTYRMVPGASAELLVRSMVERFREQLDDGLGARIRAQGRSLREIVTLASLIEKETGVAGERRWIAAVFLNRLTRGMRLQCDPTVLYALERAGRPVPIRLHEHLDFPSAYNTYVHAGLPPGPIASPGRAALEAAVAPESVPYLYFVAAPDGGHRFSVDLNQHNREVARLRRSRPARAGSSGA